MVLFNLYLCIACFFTKPPDSDIDSLFYRWNKSTLHSIRDGIDHAATMNEKASYSNRFAARPAFWEIETDSLNKESIRWKFLKTISLSFNWKDKNWTVIEVMKSGERVRLMNYLICYDNSGARIISYDYVGGEWVKLNERQMRLKMKDLTLKTTKGLYESGDYSHDLILTNFKSSSILSSTYFLETSLSKSSKIVSIVN